MSNVSDLRSFIEGQPVGVVLEIATSQYADNTTPPGHRFDYYSTAPAVRSLIKAGLIEGESRWRYYEVTRKEK